MPSGLLAELRDLYSKQKVCSSYLEQDYLTSEEVHGLTIYKMARERESEREKVSVREAGRGTDRHLNKREGEIVNKR